jgi:formylglycine-generating enzyme required for sulfatase activity
MVWIPGGTFRMGSDAHYPEERPTHRASIDGFWIDRYPVTNERFARFIEATGHTTFAEVPPDPKDYPGALPHMLYAGSMVFFRPDGPVDRRNIGNWWQFMRGATWRHPYGPASSLVRVTLTAWRTEFDRVTLRAKRANHSRVSVPRPLGRRRRSSGRFTSIQPFA